jgi:hypothetical protein
MDGVMEGLPVAVEIVPEPAGLVTAALASPRISMLGHLEVTPQGGGSRIGQLFGTRAVQVGDEAFDRTYVVKTTDEALALTLLSPGAQAEALALGCRRLVYDDGSKHGHPPLVMIELPGVVVRAETLDRLLRCIIVLARAQLPSDCPYR